MGNYKRDILTSDKVEGDGGAALAINTPVSESQYKLKKQSGKEDATRVSTFLPIISYGN